MLNSLCCEPDPCWDLEKLPEPREIAFGDGEPYKVTHMVKVPVKLGAKKRTAHFDAYLVKGARVPMLIGRKTLQKLKAWEDYENTKLYIGVIDETVQLKEERGHAYLDLQNGADIE